MEAVIGRPKTWEHPSYRPIADLIECMEAQGFRTVDIPPRVGRVLHAAEIGRVPRIRRRQILVPMMGPRWDLVASSSLLGTPVPLIWDMWETDADSWIKNLRRYRIASVMCTANASAELLKGRGYEGRVTCIPEATNVGAYSPVIALAERSISVLELGRRHPRWHAAVTRELQSRQVDHLYEKRIGEILFPSYRELVEGFANSVVSVCFPRSMTHPQVAGSVETFTHRYLESMASGCLILGHAPQDLVDLCGYNPVVEVDWRDPAAQVVDILSDRQRWQALVVENVKTVHRVGTWEVRSGSIADVLRAGAE